MGTTSLFVFTAVNIVLGSEIHEFQCLMCKLKEHSWRQYSTSMDIEAQLVEPQSGVQVKVPAVPEVKRVSS